MTLKRPNGTRSTWYVGGSGILPAWPVRPGRLVPIAFLTIILAFTNVSQVAAAPEPAVLGFSVTTSVAVEGAIGDHLVVVVRTGETRGSVSVSFATASGTAQDGRDFVGSSGALTFPRGASQQEITIPILDDRAAEADETFTLVLSDPEKNADLGNNIVHTVTIIDDDSTANQPPVVDPVGDQTVAEGDTLTVTITSSDPDSDPIALTIDPALPPWAGFVDHTDGTATLTATPGPSDAGTYGPYTITATDGTLTDTETIHLTVTPPGPCNSTPGALQAVIDAAPDGQGITDPKVKLVDAEAEGYVVIDLEGQCFENQGTVVVAGRYGLWIRQAETTGTSWVTTDSAFVTFSSATLPDGDFITENSTAIRNEHTQAATLRFTQVVDAYVGSATISGPTVFDSMARNTQGASFVRNSSFDTVEITGVIDGFKLEGSTLAAPPLVTCLPCDQLVLGDLIYP